MLTIELGSVFSIFLFFVRSFSSKDWLFTQVSFSWVSYFSKYCILEITWIYLFQGLPPDGQFLVSWVPLRTTFWLENLPLKSTEFYNRLGAKVMKKELNYLASKRWGKNKFQELRSTPFKQEIDPRQSPLEWSLKPRIWRGDVR
jgi:hypothetical protein